MTVCAEHQVPAEKCAHATQEAAGQLPPVLRVLTSLPVPGAQHRLSSDNSKKAFRLVLPLSIDLQLQALGVLTTMLTVTFVVIIVDVMLRDAHLVSLACLMLMSCCSAISLAWHV